jgi:hypothetical protein
VKTCIHQAIRDLARPALRIASNHIHAVGFFAQGKCGTARPAVTWWQLCGYMRVRSVFNRPVSNVREPAPLASAVSEFR